MDGFDENGAPVCGVWISPDGRALLSVRANGGGRAEISRPYRPFVWASASAEPLGGYSSCEPLSGPEGLPLDRIFQFENPGDYGAFLKSRPRGLPLEKVACLENQFLMETRGRMFSGMAFSEIARMQLDIETSSEGGFPDPARPWDRVIAVGIGFRGEIEILEISGLSDAAEAELLGRLSDRIRALNPDTIEGHNIFRFDLDFIRRRSKRLGVPMDWGRFGAPCSFRSSRIKIAERIFDYPRCDIPGRTVVDTLLLLQLYDISARELDSYSLKSAAIHFGFSREDERTYIEGSKIQDAFASDREAFRRYLSDDVRETRELASRLLPAYVAQVQNFPLTLQECMLRGTGMKVEYVFLEEYLHARAKLPEVPQAGNLVSGGFSESFKSGVFKNVLHYDIASLYPSLMLAIGRCPQNDYLKVFLSVLSRLRSYRLEYKKLAREARDPGERSEYNARQASFKILINSFYGYLGLSTARFGDAALADEITTAGREILAGLISDFTSEGCEVLEADTDGIYVSCGEFFGHPEKLLPRVSSRLPKGVELEFDGAYRSMFCYKAKNYALLGEDGVLLKGSALRSRSMEGFLRRLTNEFINIELGVSEADISELMAGLRGKISGGGMDVSELAKSEHLGMSVEAYRKSVAASGKGRRAALEAASKLSPPPRVGDRVSYFISNAEFAKGPDWKRAWPVEMYDSEKLPYDPAYYLKKVDDWAEKFAEFLPRAEPLQGELF